MYRRADINTAPIPIGWAYLNENVRVYREPTGKAGVSAGAFVNSTTNEIVISFTGTQPGIVDWIRGNMPAASGFYSSAQVEEAIKFVSDVMATAAGKTISFTGHSLGGGLASLLGPRTGVRFRLGKKDESSPQSIWIDTPSKIVTLTKKQEFRARYRVAKSMRSIDPNARVGE